MAIWQYEFYLLPKKRVVDLFSSVPTRLTRQEYELTDWWEGHNLTSDHEVKVSQILPRQASWSDEIKSWGNEEGNRIDICFDNNTIEEILVRVDVRDISYQFIDRILSLTRDLNCLLLTEEMLILHPIKDLLINSIKNSEAAKFVCNPEMFLQNKKHELDK
jgi:hypothetical protein